MIVVRANPEYIMKYIQDRDFRETVLKWIENHYHAGNSYIYGMYRKYAAIRDGNAC